VTTPRIIHGTDRPHTVDVALSDDESRALLGLCDHTGLRPAQVLRQALRVYQAALGPYLRPTGPAPSPAPPALRGEGRLP
jgi:hypothetical protein